MDGEGIGGKGSGFLEDVPSAMHPGRSGKTAL